MGLLRAHSVHVAAGTLLWLLILSPSASFPQSPLPEFAVTAEPAVRIVEAIDENRLVTLTGNTPPMARARFDKGRVDPALPMGDLVLVPIAGMPTLIANLYDVWGVPPPLLPNPESD